MYHICFSNPEAWEISYEEGVYGNIETGNNNKNTFWGKMIDLVALMPGDKVFFYVKKSMVLQGLFEISSEPYYCEDNLFQNPEESYPFRFNFIEAKKFVNPVPVSELAKLIENGQLYSITSFERDVQGSFRSISQLTDDEGKTIEEFFLRFNPKGDFTATKEYEHDIIVDAQEARDIINDSSKEEFNEPVRIKFSRLPVNRKRINYYVSQYENALQGYIFYCLRRNLRHVIETIQVQNFTECLLEVPLLKSQQFRSDILCLYRSEQKKPHFYSIIETKRDREISIDDLSQLIGYMKTFAASKEIPFNCIEGLYISTAFEEESVIYLRNRKNVEKENPVRLIQYFVDESGFVSFNPIDI